MEYYNAYIIAGMWYILLLWMKKGTIETPEELAKIYYDIFTNKTHRED